MDLAAAILDALSASVSAVGRAEPMASRLQRLVDLARVVGRARYAALGVADSDGDFAHFVTSGIDDELVAAIGPLPRTHGLLASTLREGSAQRSDDIGQDPRFEWWPSAHPQMKAFLGIPVRSDGEVVAAYYLADRDDGQPFDDDDEARLTELAAHTGVAVELARLWDERRELAVIEERNRLARELHDSVSQTLFSAGLLASAAETTAGTDPVASAATIAQVGSLTKQAATELRSLIFELRPAHLETDGLITALGKHVEVVSRVHGGSVHLSAHAGRRVRPRVEREVLRIAQEALGNAVRHAGPAAITVTLSIDGGTLRLQVADEGVGFDVDNPSVRGRHLGLTTMEERTRSIGGKLQITSAPGAGTTVALEVPVG